MTIIFLLITLLTILTIFTFNKKQGGTQMKMEYHYFIDDYEIKESVYQDYIKISHKGIKVEFVPYITTMDVNFIITLRHPLRRLELLLDNDEFTGSEIKKLFNQILEDCDTPVSIGITDEDGTCVYARNDRPVERFTTMDDLWWSIITETTIIPIRSYFNDNWKVAAEIFDFSNVVKNRRKEDGCLAVRWFGAYNTFTESQRFSQWESLLWEASTKNREVAAQIFSGVKDLCQKSNDRNNIIDKMEIGFLYNEEDIVEGYKEDVYSYSFGPILLPKYLEVEFKNGTEVRLGTHSECFIAKGAKPIAIVLRSFDKNIIELAENLSEETGLEIIRY